MSSIIATMGSSLIADAGKISSHMGPWSLSLQRTRARVEKNKARLREEARRKKLEVEGRYSAEYKEAMKRKVRVNRGSGTTRAWRSMKNFFAERVQENKLEKKEKYLERQATLHAEEMAHIRRVRLRRRAREKAAHMRLVARRRKEKKRRHAKMKRKQVDKWSQSEKIRREHENHLKWIRSPSFSPRARCLAFDISRRTLLAKQRKSTSNMIGLGIPSGHPRRSARTARPASARGPRSAAMTTRAAPSRPSTARSSVRGRRSVRPQHQSHRRLTSSRDHASLIEERQFAESLLDKVSVKRSGDDTLEDDVPESSLNSMVRKHSKPLDQTHTQENATSVNLAVVKALQENMLFKWPDHRMSLRVRKLVHSELLQKAQNRAANLELDRATQRLDAPSRGKKSSCIVSERHSQASRDLKDDDITTTAGSKAKVNDSLENSSFAMMSSQFMGASPLLRFRAKSRTG